MKKNKPVIVFLIKLLVSGGLLAYFLSRIQIDRFLHTFAAANLSYVALALTIYLVAQGIAAARWTALARPLGIKAPFKDMLRYYLIGMFFNLFAPSTIGGDVGRVYYLVSDEEAHAKGRPVTTVHAAMSVLMDRGIGMVVLVWLGAAGLLLFPEYPIPAAVRTTTLVFALALLIAALVIPLMGQLLPEDGHLIVAKLRLALRSYRTHWRAVGVATLLSVAIHLTQSWMHVVMGSALGLDLAFSFCIIVYPLVGTFAAIPISVNGIGLREGGYVFLLAVMGIGTETAVAFGILLFLIIALDSLLGGVLFLLQRSPRPTQVASEKLG
jgi:uncharacterized membrane protein YbhN (UPF0104 family)